MNIPRALHKVKGFQIRESTQLKPHEVTRLKEEVKRFCWYNDISEASKYIGEKLGISAQRYKMMMKQPTIEQAKRICKVIGLTDFEN